MCPGRGCGFYVRYGSPPTTSTWHCRPYLSNASESCSVNSPATGTWYVMLRGYTAFSGVTLRATFTPAASNPGPADFVIGLSPVSLTLAAGTTAQVTVSTAILQGGSQSIALSLAGLPANVTGTFSPATVSTGQSATLTLTSAANAVLGDKAFTVTGTSPSAAHQAVGLLTVVP